MHHRIANISALRLIRAILGDARTKRAQVYAFAVGAAQVGSYGENQEMTGVCMNEFRRTALGWHSQDARDNFEERSAIIRYACVVTEEQAEAEAMRQMLSKACSWCGEPHAGGPENCERHSE